MRTKLIAIWKVLTNNHWFLFTASGDVTGVAPKDIAYMHNLVDMAERFRNIGKEKKEVKNG